MLKIITVPNSILSSPTKPVVKLDGKIKNLLIEMEKTLSSQKDPKGVGLAANQIGQNLSLFIIKSSEKAKTNVFINPKIIKTVGEQFIAPEKKGVMNHAPTKKSRRQPVKLEGCLSIPRIWGSVKRAKKIYLEYIDVNGKSHKKWFSGFEATIIQHEIDHLQGKVFTQRSMEQNQPIYKEVGDELKPYEI
ncbi:peptide deformylase [Candidatus Roizmanbacteria bacterium]|nr:peptide deformylase [Candidatus Roizmanbacteria bacterium]